MTSARSFEHLYRRRQLKELRVEIDTLRALCAGKDEVDHAQRRMATRILQLLDAKVDQLDGEEQDTNQTSFSADSIDEGLKA